MRSHSINSKRLEIRLWSLPVKGFNVNLPAFSELRWFAAGLGLCWLAGCSSTKVASVPKVVVPAPVVVVEEKTIPTLVSLARTPKEYRQDAAKHIYGCNQHRIHQGKLPPLLYAIGVVTFEVSEDGKIHSFDWMRKPKQAPEVTQEIERTIKAAEPFPAPIHLGRVRYTETWLWHKSGKFQLDTLTEGQI
jgi:periplasmic protein TonB